jgi:enoyl-CoA hydratase/carnithine racemase
MTFPHPTLDVTHSTEPGPTGLPFPLHDIAVRLARSSVISIASVRGRARGSGAEFIVSCDMSFASREKANLGHW